jgi:hypothetical protein
MSSQSRQNDRGPRELDGVTKWSLTVLIITCLLTLGYWIIHAARVEDTRARFSASLPGDYPETIKAMLAFADTPCVEVCGLTAARVVPGRAAFHVACSVGTNGCAHPQNYTLTLEPAPEPSR